MGPSTLAPAGGYIDTPKLIEIRDFKCIKPFNFILISTFINVTVFNISLDVKCWIVDVDSTLTILDKIVHTTHWRYNHYFTTAVVHNNQMQFLHMFHK